MNVGTVQKVQREEYETMFDFYVNQLGFQYIKVEENEVKRTHDLLSDKQTVIERVQCGNDLMIYFDDSNTTKNDQI